MSLGGKNVEAVFCFLKCAFFEKKSREKAKLQESYWYLDFGRLWGCSLAGKIMDVVLCFLKFAFFGKKLQKMISSKIVLVSGLWAPPGPRLGGHNYTDFDMIFEMRSFF